MALSKAMAWCQDLERRWQLPKDTLDARRLWDAAIRRAGKRKALDLLTDVCQLLAAEHPREPPAGTGALNEFMVTRMRKAAVRKAWKAREQPPLLRHEVEDVMDSGPVSDARDPQPMTVERHIESDVECSRAEVLMWTYQKAAALMLRKHYVKNCRDQPKGPDKGMIEKLVQLERHVLEKDDLPPKIEYAVKEKLDRLAAKLAIFGSSLMLANVFYLACRLWAGKKWIVVATGTGAAVVAALLIIRPKPPSEPVTCTVGSYGCYPANVSYCNEEGTDRVLQCLCPNPDDDNKGTILEQGTDCETRKARQK